jgi:hypothetical protein
MRTRVLLALIATLFVSGCRQPRGPTRAFMDPAWPTQPLYLLPCAIEESKVVLLEVRNAGYPPGGSSYPPGSSQEEQIRRAIEDLLAFHPGYDEGGRMPFLATAKRLHTMIPPGTRLLGLQVTPSLIAIDLSAQALRLDRAARYLPDFHTDSGLIFSARPSGGDIALAQLVFTATWTCPKAGVQVLIAGQKRHFWDDSAMSGDISEPRHRRDLTGAFVVSAG